jgi:hypothetical protein
MLKRAPAGSGTGYSASHLAANFAKFRSTSFAHRQVAGDYLEPERGGQIMRAPAIPERHANQSGIFNELPGRLIDAGLRELEGESECY